MTINKFNYEAFALDYLEGTLSAELTEEMERFLATHPAIEAELSGMMEMVYLEPDTSIVFEDKTALLKEEKVVWLSKKWIRPLMAAASVALLLMTYFSGYQAGVKQGDEVVVISEGNENSSSNSGSSSVVVDEGNEERAVADKLLELPVVEESKLEKTVARFVPESKVEPKIINKSNVVIGKEQLEEIVIDTPVDIYVERLQVAENELVEPVVLEKVVANKEPINLAPVALIKPNLVSSINNNQSLNNLERALNKDVPVEKLAGITIQKKKRRIKDFLGRFPVTQLKEALIPTYYKEENAGQ